MEILWIVYFLFGCGFSMGWEKWYHILLVWIFWPLFIGSYVSDILSQNKRKGEIVFKKADETHEKE